MVSSSPLRERERRKRTISSENGRSVSDHACCNVPFKQVLAQSKTDR